MELNTRNVAKQLHLRRRISGFPVNVTRERGLMPNARFKDFRRNHFWGMFFAAAIVLLLLFICVAKFIP